MSPNSSAITLRCVFVNVESLSLEPPVRDTIHSGDVILAFLFNPHLIGCLEQDAKLFTWYRGSSDDGMVQAGSGVTGQSLSDGFHLILLYGYTGKEYDHAKMEVEEEEAIEMIQKLQKLLEFQMNLLVVKEEVADECNHGPLTSLELRTTFCDLYEILEEELLNSQSQHQ
ncbi:hypothetical protein Tco_0866218 [Tanacetum coccineum]